MGNFIISGIMIGLRGRSIHGAFFLALALIAFAYFAAAFSPRQPQTVALDVGVSGLRFGLVLLALFWVQDLVSREIDRRTVMFYLAYPLPRHTYLLGRYAAIMLLLLLALLLMGLMLWLLVMVSHWGYAQDRPVDLGLNYALMLLGLWLDAAVVAAFALWVAAVSTVGMLPLVMGALFAIAGRALGPIFEYLQQGAGGQEDLVRDYLPLLESVQLVLPDLSRLDWRAFSLYAQPLETAPLAWGAAMAFAYIGVMLAMANWFFVRREFN